MKIKRLLPEMKEFRWWILGSISGIGIAALADLALPMLLAEIIDKGIGMNNPGHIWNVGFRMLLVTLLALVAAIFGNYCAAQFGTGFSRKMRAQIFSKVQTFSLEEIDQFGTASLITRNTNDVDQIQRFLLMMVRVFVRFPILLVGGSIMAYLKSPRLAAPLVFSIPLIALIIFLISRFIVPLFISMREKLDNVNRVIREQITGIRVVRAFGTGDHESDRFDEISRDYTKTGLKMMRTVATLGPALTVVMNITVISILVLSSRDVNTGLLLDDGTTIAVIQYVMQILFAMVMVSMMFIVYPNAVASGKRIFEVLDMEPSIQDLKVSKMPDETIKGRLEFRNVGFTFPGAERPTIENLSFVVEKGETLALIGSTGSGKSTILRLIMRFYDVTQGSILLDGIDLREMSQEEIRNRIGYVPQQSQLYSGTITDNLRFGKENASLEEMIVAAETAQALDFIQQEEGEFEAHVARSGTNFSGGQKQRLSIARAIVKDPEILLFDDSLSALDAATDLRLRQALKRDLGNTTQVIVAQRVSSVSTADQIIVLDHGRVSGQGTHKELLETNAIYREIADSQFSEEEVAG